MDKSISFEEHLKPEKSLYRVLESFLQYWKPEKNINTLFLKLPKQYYLQNIQILKWFYEYVIYWNKIFMKKNRS